MSNDEPLLTALERCASEDEWNTSCEHLTAWQELADILDLFVDATDEERLRLLPKRQVARRKVTSLGYKL